MSGDASASPRVPAPEGASGSAESRIAWASYFAARGETEQAPTLSDVPDNRRAARNVLLATVLAAALVFATIALPRMVGADGLRFLLDLVGAVTLFLWLLLVLPQIVAHARARRWRRAFVRLCEAPQRAVGELRGVELRVQGAGVTVISGSVVFAGPGGEQHEVPLVSGLGKIQASFQVQLPRALAPSAASHAVVWHTNDLSVIHTRVHADGTGAA